MTQTLETSRATLARTMRALLGTVPRLLKAYAWFAVLHVIFKVLKKRYQVGLKVKAVAGLPGYDLDPTAKATRENLHRINNWRSDVVNGFPGADFVRLPAPGVSIVCKSQRAVQWLLSDGFNNNTKASQHENPVSYLLGEFIGHDGIFRLRHGNQTPELSRDHEKWLHQRKQASKVFTRRAFNDLMHTVFKAKSLEFAGLLDAHCGSDNADDALDMQELYSAFTLDSTLTIFFGMDSATLRGDPSTIGNAFDTAQRAMMKLVYSSIPAFHIAGLAPWPFAALKNTHAIGSAGLAVSFARNPHHHTFRAAIAELDAEIYPMIKELRAVREGDDQQQHDNGENAGDDSESQRRHNNLTKLFMHDPSFSDQELRDLMLNMVIAGRDTTSNALSWLTALLTQHPEQQRLLCEEIDAAAVRVRAKQAEEGLAVVNETEGGPVVPTLADLSSDELPYLNGCVYEALRLFPPVPFDSKVVVEDCDVPFGLGGRFLAGTRISFCAYAMGRDPERWPAPLAFKPERWIPFKTPSAFEFPVFQGGPRSCLGQNMALFEMKMLMFVLMQNRFFELKEGEAEHLTPSLQLTIAVCNSKQKMGTGEDTHNLWVHPRRRSSN